MNGAHSSVWRSLENTMNSPETGDQRQFTRIPFDSPVQITGSNGTWHTRLIDISLNGVLTQEPQDWNAGPNDTFVLDLDLYDSGVEIRMEVTVAHREAGRVGFQCQHIDLDSITHLRRLVELNIGNTEILNRELSALGSH
jgi:hypothetical protein